MGKFEIFQVLLPNHGRVLSGTTLSGEVHLRLKKDMEVNRIYVMLFGGATVSFDDELTHRQIICRFEDRETIVSEQRILYNRQDYNCVIMRLVRGEMYTFPFSFELIRDLPSSFMSNISYRVTAFIDAFGKSYETGQNVMLMQDFDLNTYCGPINLVEPFTAWHPLRHSLSGNGLVCGKISVKKRGFAIGETINVEVEIHNNTRTKMENLNLCLVQNGSFKAKGVNNSLRAERSTKLLCKNVALGRLKPGEKLNAVSVSLVVPWVVSNGLGLRCRLADVSYCLQLTTSTTLSSAVTGAGAAQRVCIGPDFRKTELINCLCETEIVIGVRPLENSLLNQLDNELEENKTVNNNGALKPTAPPNVLLEQLVDQDWTMFNMPSAPPSYDQAIGRSVSTNGEEKVPLD